METIQSVLMCRDGVSKEEADEMVQNARDDLQERLAMGELPDEICMEHFGLEEDYLDQLIYM